MYVCSCRAVTDRTICELAAWGVCDEEGVGRACGAGTRCGGCLPMIRKLLAEAAAAATEAGTLHQLPSVPQLLG